MHNAIACKDVVCSVLLIDVPNLHIFLLLIIQAKDKSRFPPQAPVVDNASPRPRESKKAKKEKKSSSKRKHKDLEARRDAHEVVFPKEAMAVDAPGALPNATASPPATTPQPLPPAPASAAPTAPSAFETWYLSQMAECFGDEIEALQDADAPVHPRVLMKAFAMAAPLFSAAEQRTALAGGGTKGITTR